MRRGRWNTRATAAQIRHFGASKNGLCTDGFPFKQTAQPKLHTESQRRGQKSMTNETESTLSDSMANTKNSSQFVGFRLANQHYVFPISQIQEIVILEQVTKTPQVAEYVDGVSNLRGTIIPIINLRRLFGLEAKPVDSETRTIVVNVESRTMGCTVDSVTQVMRISTDNIQPAPEVVAGSKASWISGFAKLDEQLLVVLNINELLDPTRLEEVHEAILASGPRNQPPHDAAGSGPVSSDDTQTHTSQN